MSTRRSVGIAALMAGAAGAAVAGAVTAQRRVVRQARNRPDPYAGEAFGSLHTRGIDVVASDGTTLHVEVDGDQDAPLTVVFAHGYTLCMDAWHFQRRDLADAARLVFYDQRSHGASGRSAPQHCTIDQLGRDLYDVLQAVAPSGPVVLVGHSMGGMTILALADQHPELFGERVVGVGLMSTSSGELAKVVIGLPGWLSRFVYPVLPRATKLAQSRAAMLERGRRQGSDISYLAIRYISFSSKVPASLVDFMERMVADTPLEVMLQFFDTFLTHDKLEALGVLRDIPVLISCGDGDVLTPLSHSQVMADALPDAELQVIPGANHMAKLEQNTAVTRALRQLIARALDRSRAAVAG